MKYLIWLLLLLIAACSKPAPVNLTPTAETVQQTLQPDNPDSLCASMESGWNQNWALVIAALEKLVEIGHDCHGQSSIGKLYAAHVNYGAQLEVEHQEIAAVSLYQAALLVRRDGIEALNALDRLNAPLPAPPPLATCTQEEITAAVLPPYVPAPGEFVQIKGTKFILEGEIFLPQGINYFPARYPWRRFLTEADLETIEAELSLLKATGFNSLRIFLWYDALFQCPGSGAVPRPESFTRLDGLVKIAAQLNLRLIVTLHDLPDLTWYPLYTNPEHSQAQTAFIVERYKNEPAIFAWDIRNEGDIDYTRGNQSRDEVLGWLGETAALIQEIDKNHLITAGWLSDELATLPYVDFISFHFWTTPTSLAVRLNDIRQETDKPIVLEEFGYSTFSVDETTQANLITAAIQTAEREGAAGWLIWTAFDFSTDVTCIPPACPDLENQEHHFGLWDSDYTPKPAVEALISVLN